MHAIKIMTSTAKDLYGIAVNNCVLGESPWGIPCHVRSIALNVVILATLVMITTECVRERTSRTLPRVYYTGLL